MNKPLADRIRPTELDDVVGQRHLLEKGKALRSLIDSGDIPNLIFYGPSGVGKTTVASIIASKTNRSLRRLNGTTASTQDIKDIVSELDTFSAPNGILLYLDEIQYFNKRQQQSLLEFIENGKITLIASTTENPYFYIYPAILSRSTVFEFKAVESEDIIPAVKRGFNILSEEYQVELEIDEEVLKRISVGCGGDVRKSLNSVENCFFATPTVDGKKHIELDIAKQLVQKSAVRYDKEGDEHYDIVSAYQKSMRGSDPDAALYYLARMLYAGEDIRFISRRIMICAAEDVSNADPQALVVATAASQAVMQLGMPEARIILAQAATYVACAPKSNSAIMAIDGAMEFVKAHPDYKIPSYLQDAHYKGAAKLGHGIGYKYAHDYKNHYARQQYLPDACKDIHFYNLSEQGYEKRLKEHLTRIHRESEEDNDGQ